MSITRLKQETVQAVEAIMMDHFRNEPFHNLHLICSPRIATRVPGGTCSDKTLRFIADSKRSGLNVSLHCGYIGGKEIHRLARVEIGGSLFFADVGNGWPSVKLYPAEREVSFRCFGMGFRTEISNGRVSVFHEKKESEYLQLEIDVCTKPESDIFRDVQKRFNSGIVYPFSNSIRFSQIVGDRFLFLRGDQLEIYTETGFKCISGIDDAQVADVIYQNFGHDILSVFGERDGGVRHRPDV